MYESFADGKKHLFSFIDSLVRASSCRHSASVAVRTEEAETEKSVKCATHTFAFTCHSRVWRSRGTRDLLPLPVPSSLACAPPRDERAFLLAYSSRSPSTAAQRGHRINVHCHRVCVYRRLEHQIEAEETLRQDGCRRRDLPPGRQPLQPLRCDHRYVECSGSAPVATAY